jgi:hypothetical protein
MAEALENLRNLLVILPGLKNTFYTRAKNGRLRYEVSFMPYDGKIIKAQCNEILTQLNIIIRKKARKLRIKKYKKDFIIS